MKPPKTSPVAVSERESLHVGPPPPAGPPAPWPAALAAHTAPPPLAPGPGPVAAAPAAPLILMRGKELVTPALKEAVRALPPDIQPIVEYHLGWVDAAGRPEARGGKAVRPALAILSAEAAGAPASTGIPGAVAIELVHNFSLLHDDVMDGDRERRHRPTVWALWGVGQAIIVGDALMALALQVLLDRGDPAAMLAGRRLLADTAAMIAGQVEDEALEGRRDVTLDECRGMEAKKTGALLACASSLGAILAGAPAPVVQGLSDYGLHLGLAFQAIDDLLGIWGRPEVTGKPVWSDLRQGKNSVPIAAALCSGRAGAEELRRMLKRSFQNDASPGARRGRGRDRREGVKDAGSVHSSATDATEDEGSLRLARTRRPGLRSETSSKGDGLSEGELARAVDLIEACGGRDVAEAEAKRELTAALAALERISIEPQAHAELVGLARFLGERDY